MQRHFILALVALLVAWHAQAADDSQWTMPTKDFQDTRYTSLDLINNTNAANLKVAWTFDTSVHRGQEAAPLVVSNVMYIVTPYPNIVYALDPSKQGALKWKYEPKPKAAAQGVACCDVVNRGCTYDSGHIFFNTLDGDTICLDANTGKEVWKTELGDINKGETITMAPMVVKDKVFVGNSGGEFGVRGWLTALDAKTGKMAWRAWSTGPDSDCLIGSDFKPFYDGDKGTNLGVATWPPEHWKIGGGTVWGFVTYDPELNLLYYGTANPGSWNPELRPGDNKWTCGVFARHPENGQAVWFYQFSPHDLFDHDGINENMVIDTDIQGKPRKLLVHPDRNGYVYVMDRQTGEVISATPFVRITASKGVDLKSGRLIHNDEKTPHMNKVIRDVEPVSSGAKDWQPCSWSPKTKLLYIPHQNLAMDYEAVSANYIAGTPYLGVNVKMYPRPGSPRGEICAWDLDKQAKVWTNSEFFPIWSGTLATAGDVVFYGTMEGWFKALDAKTGKELWKFKCGSGIIGQPTTFKLADGKQYVAILSGVGGWAGAIVAGGLDPRDPTAALGFVGAMKDLPEHTGKGGTLYVFSL